MPLSPESDVATWLAAADRHILLVMVPGMGMQTGDFHANGLFAKRRNWGVPAEAGPRHLHLRLAPSRGQH